MKTDLKQEGWVKYFRHYCYKGFIDRYIGDQAHDPNRSTRGLLSLNASTTWYRLNGEGGWIHKYNFRRTFYSDLMLLRSEFTADEMWSDGLLPPTQQEKGE